MLGTTIQLHAMPKSSCTNKPIDLIETDQLNEIDMFVTKVRVKLSCSKIISGLLMNVFYSFWIRASLVKRRFTVTY